MKPLDWCNKNWAGDIAFKRSMTSDAPVDAPADSTDIAATYIAQLQNSHRHHNDARIVTCIELWEYIRIIETLSRSWTTINRRSARHAAWSGCKSRRNAQAHFCSMTRINITRMISIDDTIEDAMYKNHLWIHLCPRQLNRLHRSPTGLAKQDEDTHTRSIMINGLASNQ